MLELRAEEQRGLVNQLRGTVDGEPFNSELGGWRAIIGAKASPVRLPEGPSPSEPSEQNLDVLSTRIMQAGTCV